jgi:prolyl 4-hydroxylase
MSAPTLTQAASPLDLHGSDWRDWVISNLARGCKPESLFKDMTKSTWRPVDAQRALLQALGMTKHAETFKLSPLPSLPDAASIKVGGREISILSRSTRPQAALIAGVLTPKECSEMVNLARGKGLFEQDETSGVIDPQSGESVENVARTSTSVCFSRGESPLIGKVEQRLSTLLNWPIENGEGVQILRYQPGQEYRPHFDWFDPNKAGSRDHLKRGGQRVATTIVFLTRPISGGETSFPKAGVQMQPLLGGAAFFRNIDALGQPDPYSLHAGNPVKEGEKIVLTYWQREHCFE